MQITIHQTRQEIGDFDVILDYLSSVPSASSDEQKLHIFPELFLTGYPLQDLCLQKPFFTSYYNLIEKINQWSISNFTHSVNSEVFILGGLDYSFDQEGLPLNIENVIFQLELGQKLKKVYSKRLLPNYDIFDEKKYFSPGKEKGVLTVHGVKIGVLICEDMWYNSPCFPCDVDPVADLSTSKVDLIINISASPYSLGKYDKRVRRAHAISNYLGAPFIYTNCVGGEDEILFDGRSFVVNGDEEVLRLDKFTTQVKKIDLPQTLPSYQKREAKVGEDLFIRQRVEQSGDDETCKEILDALVFGLNEYSKKSGINKFLVAVSGGIDSALVLAIAKLGLLPGQYLEAIFMPGIFTSSLSYDLAQKLCTSFEVPLSTIPIKFMQKVCENSFDDNIGEKLEGIANENMQSRLRGMLLFARANQTNSLVLNTSNKSELAVGYSTLYGDSVGALSLLGDLYKSEVYFLAKFINKKLKRDLIPVETITRAPTAELRDGQFDGQSLPPYDRLDNMLEMILSYRATKDDLYSEGFSWEEINQVFTLYHKAEFKRRQFCPIIKVKPKSFGFGYRVPICKSIKFYL